MITTKFDVLKELSHRKPHRDPNFFLTADSNKPCNSFNPASYRAFYASGCLENDGTRVQPLWEEEHSTHSNSGQGQPQTTTMSDLIELKTLADWRPIMYEHVRKVHEGPM